MSKLRILELEAQVERKDKYILELESETKCVALCVHKRAKARIDRQNELLGECHNILAENNWRGDLQDKIRELLNTK